MKTDRGTALVIIDMHNDFTDGSPACRHTEESVSRAVRFIDKATAGQHGDEAEILDTFPILFVGGSMAHEAEMPDPLKPYVSEELSFNTENGKLSVADAANTAGQSVGTAGYQRCIHLLHRQWTICQPGSRRPEKGRIQRYNPHRRLHRNGLLTIFAGFYEEMDR